MKRSIQVITLLTVLCACLFANYRINAVAADILPSTTSQSYDSVLSLKTEGYQNLCIADFNATVKQKIDTDIGFLDVYSELLDSITPDDSNYSFIRETLNSSIKEVICQEMGVPISISQYLKRNEGAYSGGENDTFYSFMFTSLYSVEYRINAKLTVCERDILLVEYHTELQNTVSEMNQESLTAQDIKTNLQTIADNLAKQLSTHSLVFENAAIQSIEIHNEG
ncbi:MAG: hypothetical protein GX096_05340 [Clostridiales bacterium]|nr:hypothetical protein [Clostridiales bacterium]